MRQRMLTAVLVTAGFLALWVMPPMNDWFRAFVKLEPMRAPYTVAYFVILLCALTLFARWIGAHRFIFVVGVGACVGQFAATLSIFVANFFLPNGLERTARTLDRDGIVGIVVTDFSVAAILGGWLLGAAAFAAMKWMITRQGMTASKR